MRLALVAGLVTAFGSAAAAPRAGQVVRVEHRDPQTAPSRGPTNALVTIELFLVPQAGGGNKIASTFKSLEKLQAAHPSRIRVIYRVLKRNAQAQLPNAAMEAHAQGKFFEFMDKLNAVRSTQTLTHPQILDLAKSVGLDGARVSAAISEGRYADVFAVNDRRLERLLFRSAVPNLFFNSKPPQNPQAMSDADYEAEYKRALDRANDLIDQGYDPRDLMTAFDAQTLRGEQPIVASGSADSDPDSDPTYHRLATPPLDLRGMPSFGSPEIVTVPVIVVCKPDRADCKNTLGITRRLQEIYAEDVRVVWAPWINVADERAGEQALLGDAVLCAEQVGSSPNDLAASPGWLWIVKQLERAGSRRQPAEKLIDLVARDFDIDSGRMSACRARMANTTLDWVGSARRSGVTGSSVVIGGRIYEGLGDEATIQRLIEAELAPGVLGSTTDSQFDRLLFFLASPRRR